MLKYCQVKLNNDKTVDAVFMGIFQRSTLVPPSPMVGGHDGGMVARPVVVVRIGDEIREVSVRDIILRYREEDF